MRLFHRLAAGMGTAIVLSLAGTAAIHAQTRSGPGYIVVEINVRDQEGFKEYAEKATKTVEQHGGKFIVLGGSIQTIEGPNPNGAFVIIRFDSVEAARKWLSSPEYSAVKGIRHRTADARQYLVEGLATE